MKSGTSTASTKTVFVSRTQRILFSPDSLDIRIFSGFGVSHFALDTSTETLQKHHKTMRDLYTAIDGVERHQARHDGGHHHRDH